jgi:uncharacterized protein YkwD
MQTLINDYRKANGLSALNTNQELTVSARTHAADMLCNNYFSNVGLDGSTPQSRLSAQGFPVSLAVEDIYAASNATPQSAMEWWKGNTAANADLLNPNTTIVGISFIQSPDSLFGGYFVVLSAKP